MLEQLPGDSLQDAIGRGRVPIEALFEQAHVYLEQGMPKKGASLLEPLFASPVRKPDEAHDYAMNLLCDLYDDLDHYKKKEALLQHVINTTRRSPLRSGAWQRFAAIHMDSYDIAGAWKAFRKALQDDPDSHSIGILEVQLLMAEDRVTEAQARAEFWMKRLRRMGLPDDEGPLAFLNDHPEAFDSLDIIDDLATAVILHDQYDTSWLDEALLKPLLLRAANIIDQALSGIASPRIVWAFTENRPALRSLARLVGLHMRAGDETNAMAWARRLLALNSDDNHGFRGMVVNQLLIDGDDAGVLEIAGSYTHDLQPEIPYGQVLSLYRLQRLEEAQDALYAAMENLPKVARYLTAKRVRTPQLDPRGVRFGGDDHAWFYRDAMRDVWLETSGAIDWLKQAAKRRK